MLEACPLSECPSLEVPLSSSIYRRMHVHCLDNECSYIRVFLCAFLKG